MKKVVLRNGLTVILEEDHSAPVAALQMCVKVGSAMEQAHEAGISHLFEHMLFKGTRKRGVGEIAQEVEACGGDINAYTSFDETVYHLILASRFFDTGLDILADAVQHSAFDPVELAREKEVVIEEIKRYEDMPVSRLSQEVFSTSFTVHPYHRPIIGYEATVRKFTRAQILRFFKSWYAPNNMVLIVVGDFDIPDALSKVRRSFRGFRPARLPQGRLPSEPRQRATRSVLMFDEVGETYLETAFHIPAIMHADIVPLDIASVLLGQGESSRLYMALRDRQELVHSVYTHCFTPMDPGLFLVGGTLDAAAAREALAAAMGEVRRLHHEPVDEAELDKARLAIESDFVFQKESVQGQARKLGFFEVLMGDVARENDYLRALRAVRPDDVQQAVRRHLTAENFTYGLLAPRGAHKQLREPLLTKTVKQALQPPRRRLAARHGRNGANRSPRRLRQGRQGATPQLHVLDNGVRIIIKENRTVPVFAVRAISQAGIRYETAARNGVSNFVAEMLTKGTTRRSAADLARSVESMAGSLHGFSGRNSFGVAADFLSRYADAGLELVTEVLLESSFDPTEMVKRRTEIVAAIHEQQDDAVRITFNLLNRAFYGRHPYGREQLGTEQTITLLQRSQLVNFYHRFLQPDNLVVSVVGDVDAESALKNLARALGQWKPKRRPLPALPQVTPPTSIRMKSATKDLHQAHLGLAFAGPGFLDDERYAMMVLNALLSGQGGRLFLELRDRRSMAYSVTSFLQAGIDIGLFGVYIGTSPEKLPEAYTGMVRELRRISERRVSNDELTRAKKSIVGNYEIGLQKNSFQAFTLATNELFGLGIEAYEGYARRIMRVSARDVLAAAQARIDLQRFGVAVLQPPGISFDPRRGKSVGNGRAAARAILSA